MHGDHTTSVVGASGEFAHRVVPLLARRGFSRVDDRDVAEVAAIALIEPVGPSALPAKGKFKFPDREADFPVPRVLAADEIPAIINDVAQATRNARDAGFDGVELHGANGYLHDQFLQDISNKRTDEWGGSVENRARLMLETIDAMATAWSIDRIGIRLGVAA